MFAKLKSAARISTIAFLPCLLLLSAGTKQGCRKYGPNQPISWDQLIDRLPTLVLGSLAICMFMGLSTILDRKRDKPKIVCPRCGVPQEERPEDKHFRTRSCFACREVSSRLEWTDFCIGAKSSAGEGRG